MKKIIIILLVLGVVGAFFGYTQYNKTHESLESVKADQTMDAAGIYASYENDETSANEKFNGKVVEVSGIIQSVSTDESGLLKVTLDSENDFGGVICQMNKEKGYTESDFDEGSKVTLRGDCTGFLLDVVMIRCVKIE